MDYKETNKKDDAPNPSYLDEKNCDLGLYQLASSIMPNDPNKESKEKLVKASLEIEPVAFELRSSGPSRDDIAKITWQDLRKAPLGTTWDVVAYGSLYNESRHATLVFRNEECAALLLSHSYQEDGMEQNNYELRVFVFARPNTSNK